MFDGFIPCCLHSTADFFFSSVLHLEDVENGNVRWVVGHITKESPFFSAKWSVNYSVHMDLLLLKRTHQNDVDNQLGE